MLSLVELQVARNKIDMQTITLKAHTDHLGLVKLEIPTDLPDREVEIVLVMQALTQKSDNTMGYPPGYFDETYGSFADEPLERDQPEYPDVRDTIE